MTEKTTVTFLGKEVSIAAAEKGWALATDARTLMLRRDQYRMPEGDPAEVVWRAKTTGPLDVLRASGEGPTAQEAATACEGACAKAYAQVTNAMWSFILDGSESR